MFCRTCGRPVDPQAFACAGCGVPPNRGRAHCPHCAAATQPQAVVCVTCGGALGGAAATGAKSKVAAGVLGILLGTFGVHRFYLGYTGIAVAQLVLGLLGFVTCGVTSAVSGLWGLVEGILILVGSIDRDAQGVPLGD